MVVSDGLDPVPHVPMSEIIVNKISVAKMKVVPNAVHLSNIEQPEFFNPIILDWFDAQA